MQISGSIRCCLMTVAAASMAIGVRARRVARDYCTIPRPAPRDRTLRSVEPDVLEVDRLLVDAHWRRSDPSRELAALDDAAHQRRDKRAVFRGRQPASL